MRTKSILLGAALIAAGIAPSMAQQSNVFSVNVVGYVNVNVTNGNFYLLQNPLDDGHGNIITNVLNGGDSVNGNLSAVYFYQGGVLTPLETYFTGFGWFPGTNTVSPGQGVFLLATATSTITFSGNVVTNKSETLLPGFNLAGSAYPGSLNFDGLGLSAHANNLDVVLRYIPAGPNLGLNDVSTYFTGYGWFETGPTAPGGGGPTGGPTLNVAEGFYYQTTGTNAWSQNFTIN